MSTLFTRNVGVSFLGVGLNVGLFHAPSLKARSKLDQA